MHSSLETKALRFDLNNYLVAFSGQTGQALCLPQIYTLHCVVLCSVGIGAGRGSVVVQEKVITFPSIWLMSHSPGCLSDDKAKPFLN